MKRYGALVCSVLFLLFTMFAGQPKMSAREINRGELEPETQAKGPPAPGAPGSQWRMLKLKRTYQEAEDEGKPLEDVCPPSRFAYTPKLIGLSK